MKDRSVHDGEPEPDAINLPPLPPVTLVFITCTPKYTKVEKILSTPEI